MSFKRTFAGLCFAITASLALGAHASNEVAPIYLNDPVTNQPVALTLEDVQKVEVMQHFVPQVEGLDDLFKAYVDRGYVPFHAFLLANADLMAILTQLSPGLTSNPEVVSQIQDIHKLYQTK